MLDFPQPEENLDKEKTVEGETDCANLAGSRNLDNRGLGSPAWGRGATHLLVEAAV